MFGLDFREGERERGRECVRVRFLLPLSLLITYTPTEHKTKSHEHTHTHSHKHKNKQSGKNRPQSKRKCKEYNSRNDCDFSVFAFVCGERAWKRKFEVIFHKWLIAIWLLKITDESDERAGVSERVSEWETSRALRDIHSYFRMLAASSENTQKQIGKNGNEFLWIHCRRCSTDGFNRALVAFCFLIFSLLLLCSWFCFTRWINSTKRVIHCSSCVHVLVRVLKFVYVFGDIPRNDDYFHSLWIGFLHVNYVIRCSLGQYHLSHVSSDRAYVLGRPTFLRSSWPLLSWPPTCTWHVAWRCVERHDFLFCRSSR